MNIEQLKLCCGAYFIFDINEIQKYDPELLEQQGESGLYYKRMNAEYTEKYGELQVTPEKMKTLLLQWVKDYGHKSFIMAILTERQKHHYGPLFEKCGFKIESEGWQDRYSHLLYLYVRTNPAPKLVKKVKW